MHSCISCTWPNESRWVSIFFLHVIPIDLHNHIFTFFTPLPMQNHDFSSLISFPKLINDLKGFAFSYICISPSTFFFISDNILNSKGPASYLTKSLHDAQRRSRSCCFYAPLGRRPRKVNLEITRCSSLLLLCSKATEGWEEGQKKEREVKDNGPIIFIYTLILRLVTNGLFSQWWPSQNYWIRCWTGFGGKAQMRKRRRWIVEWPFHSGIATLSAEGWGGRGR